MTLTTIEKAAKLMGYTIAERKPDFNYYHLDSDTVGTFNPYTNKADLVDVECALRICVEWDEASSMVVAYSKHVGCLDTPLVEKISNHPDKFTARAHAVMAVVEQIYDRQFGGE